MILRSTLASSQRVSLDFSGFWSTHPPPSVIGTCYPGNISTTYFFTCCLSIFYPYWLIVNFLKEMISNFFSMVECPVKCTSTNAPRSKWSMWKKGDVMNDIAKTNTPEHSWFSPGLIRTKIAKTNIMAVKNMCEGLGRHRGCAVVKQLGLIVASFLKSTKWQC